MHSVEPVSCGPDAMVALAWTWEDEEELVSLGGPRNNSLWESVQWRRE